MEAPRGRRRHRWGLLPEAALPKPEPAPAAEPAPAPEEPKPTRKRKSRWEDKGSAADDSSGAGKELALFPEKVVLSNGLQVGLGRERITSRVVAASVDVECRVAQINRKAPVAACLCLPRSWPKAGDFHPV